MKISLFIVLSFFLFSCTNNQEEIKILSSKPSNYVLSCDTINFNVYDYFNKDKITRFDASIKGFADKDALLTSKDSLIVFVGSSSIRKWYSLENSFSDLPVINRGFGGSTFPELIFYANELIFQYTPIIVAIYEGDNDQYFLNPQQIFECACYLEKIIHQRLPKTEVYFISIKPSPSRISKLKDMALTNRLLADYSNSTDKTYYINVWDSCFDRNRINGDIFKSDSLHLNEKGYEIWYDLIYPQISQKYYSIVQ